MLALALLCAQRLVMTIATRLPKMRVPSQLAYDGSQDGVKYYGLALLEDTRPQTLAPSVPEGMFYPLQCRANFVAPTTTICVRWNRDFGVHK